MPPLAVLLGQRAPHPKPVLCLDTCNILEVVQCLRYERLGSPRKIDCIEPVKRLLDKLDSNPACVQLIVTELTMTEWSQNIAAIRDQAELRLAQIDRAVLRLHHVAGHAGAAVGAFDPFANTTLVDELVSLARKVLDQAIKLDLDPLSTQNAVRRVLAKTRPSHEGHIKDSMHLEHYLGLARQLRATHFGESCIFASGNRRDFWDGDSPRIHPILRPECDDPAVQLRFFGTIDAALGFLGI